MPDHPPPARPSPRPHRQGPRPLPLHLLNQAVTLLGSRAALPLWKNGLLPWRPDLAPAAAALRQSLDAAGAQAWSDLDQAVTVESVRRHAAMLAGIEAYRHHPYGRDLPPVPVIWREGTTRLLDYRQTGAEGVPVLVIPSLVNRAYILDLTARRSLLRDLAGRGLSPVLVDWDAPGPAEKSFDLTAYVARLGRALDFLTAQCGRPAALLGYCMGGNLALALALTHPGKVAALALLATPWDFHADRTGQSAILAALEKPLGDLIDRLGMLPVDLLQAMFATLDPSLAARKFIVFSQLKRTSARARNFVALEDWANDGVALAGPVARECLFGWYGGNSPARGCWRVGGQVMTPGAVTMPCLAVIPGQDRIVPSGSAQSLADALPAAQIVRATGGHVGLLLSRRAKTEVYAPLAKWLVHAAAQ